MVGQDIKEIEVTLNQRAIQVLIDKSHYSIRLVLQSTKEQIELLNDLEQIAADAPLAHKYLKSVRVQQVTLELRATRLIQDLKVLLEELVAQGERVQRVAEEILQPKG